MNTVDTTAGGRFSEEMLQTHKEEGHLVGWQRGGGALSGSGSEEGTAEGASATVLSPHLVQFRVGHAGTSTALHSANTQLTSHHTTHPTTYITQHNTHHTPHHYTTPHHTTTHHTTLCHHTPHHTPHPTTPHHTAPHTTHPPLTTLHHTTHYTTHHTTPHHTTPHFTPLNCIHTLISGFGL